MKRKACLLALAWALSLPAAAQLKVETVEITGKDARAPEPGGTPAMTMPLVLPLTGAAPANINDALYIEQFGVLAPQKVSKKFNVGEIEGTVSREFSVTRNDRIFTVEFGTEGCGAYCERYEQVFSFDAQTGWHITAADLLTEAGQDDVLRLLRKQKIAAYSEELSKNRAGLQVQPGEKVTKEAIDDLKDRIELDADCLERAKESIARESLRWYRINPAKNALLVTASRCSNHAMLALDDVGEVSVRIPYADVKAHLTPYGRALLLGEDTGKPTGLFGQVLRGRIGVSPITMLLDIESGGSVSGSYFYNRQRKKLQLRGQRRGNAIELTETVGDDATPTGRFVLAVDGLTVNGKWSDMNGHKQLEMTASPVQQ
jgi:hypothetical protein